MRENLIETAVLAAAMFAASTLAAAGDGASASGSSTDLDVTIVHLADLHLCSQAQPTVTPWTHRIVIGGYKLHHKRLDLSRELLAEAVRVITTRVQPDVVVVSGDIVDRARDRAALAAAHRLLGRLECPLIVARGDHDPQRSGAAPDAFCQYFGSDDAATRVRGMTFLKLPFNPGIEQLSRLRERLAASRGEPLRFLCLHRMLHAPDLMQFLSRKYCSTLLSPRQEEIGALLENDGGAFIVFCGHSHTDYEARTGTVRHVCTASLAEYPHHFRVVRIRGRRVRSEFIRLDVEKLTSSQGVE